MSQRIDLTGEGRCGSDPEVRSTQTGTPVANFRFGCTPSTKQGDKWVDGETVWLTVTAWQSTAEYVRDNVHKGDLLLITGTLKQEPSWSDPQTGQIKPGKLGVTASRVAVLSRPKPQQGAYTAQPPHDDAPY